MLAIESKTEVNEMRWLSATSEKQYGSVIVVLQSRTYAERILQSGSFFMTIAHRLKVRVLVTTSFCNPHFATSRCHSLVAKDAVPLAEIVYHISQ